VPIDPANPILLYDGVCGLCNRLVQFSLKRDSGDHLRFASLQSDFAAPILQRHGFNRHDLDTVYFVSGYGRTEERLSTRSAAVILVLQHIGGLWGVVAALLRMLPRWLRDCGYDMVARNRYRVFGRSENCILPEEEYRARFLDV
jgi:predicted DCC family thiol-disulfide oxidoreductase YuxK